jgi:alkylation response protein AidB-like acyl-CoA dehydrogenase
VEAVADGDQIAVMLDTVVGLARERAGESEDRRALAPSVAAAAKRSGLFCIALPAELGGLGYEPQVFADVFEQVAHADGAAGWCAFIGNATSFFGWLEPSVARPLLASAPAMAAAAIFAPSGRAVPDRRGGFVVDGRWTFASGCTHSEWLQLGVLVMDGDRPRQRDDGTPDWRFAFMPADAAQVVDTWDSLGLRGTGSHDITAAGVHVDADLLAMPMFDPPLSEAPLFRLGFWGLLATLMAPFPLGVARRALDEVTELLPAKQPPPGRTPAAQDPQIHYELGRADASLRAARAFLDDAIGGAWTTVLAGDQAGPAELTALGMAMQQSMTTALAVVDTAFRFAGSAAVYRDSVVQRCFRDVHTAAKHIGFGLEGFRAAGRKRLGLQ